MWATWILSLCLAGACTGTERSAPPWSPTGGGLGDDDGGDGSEGGDDDDGGGGDEPGPGAADDDGGSSGGPLDPGAEPEPTGIPVLGGGTHSIHAVTLEVVSTASDPLDRPTDLAFNPSVPGELWVTNMGDDSMTIFEHAGGPDQTSSRRYDPSSSGHFLARPSAIAFGTPGVMATAQQEDAVTQPSTPWDFMGPTLWAADAAFFDAGHPSHLDMLHNSPNGSGIAWETGNAYWLFDGLHGSLTRYDFHADHGLGGTDHQDGEVYRFIDGQLGYEPWVGSHVVWDGSARKVYAADTARGRIVRLHPDSGSVGEDLSPNYDGGIQRAVGGAELEVLVDGNQLEAPMPKPSGLEIQGGVLFVTDHATSIIFGFSMDGELLDWLETGLPANTLMGIAFAADGSLFAVDVIGNGILRISAGATAG